MPILPLGASILLGFLQIATTQTPSDAQPAKVAASIPASLASSPTPSDPHELLEVGRKVNGLADTQPWHLKASYEVFDDGGNSKYKGTYEEWWVSSQEYKRSYQGADFTQTEYGTDHGPLHSGDATGPSGAVASVRPSLIDPLPGPAQVSSGTLTIANKTSGNIKLRCVSVNPKIAPREGAPRWISPSYCFSLEKPMLRSSTASNYFTETLFNRILLFRGRYLAGDIDMSRVGKEYLKVHLDLLEPLAEANAADFQPTADAVPPPARRISISSGVAAGNIITKVQPEYPLAAKLNRIQGTVAIEAVIDKTGHISTLRAISGPTELQGAAVDAVRQWVYRPYLLNGEVVEVGAMMYVVFSLGGWSPVR